MTPETVTSPPGSRSARLRLLLPIAILVACLTVFLALFWHPGGHGRKGHGKSGTTAERDRSPVGGSRDEGEGNARVSSGEAGGSPVGGGPSRSSPGRKGETWWYKDGKQRRGAGEDAWWAPGSRDRKTEAGGGSSGSRSPVGGSSPVGGGSGDEDRTEARRERAEAQARRDHAEENAAKDREARKADQDARKEDRPARASSSNPGEVAGQKGGPDDFWWRK
jgi:hypothetical protein